MALFSTLKGAVRPITTSSMHLQHPQESSKFLYTNETWKFVQAKSKQAMKQVLGIRDDKARMTVTPPLAMAPVTQEDDMRWNPNDDGIVFNP